MKMSEQDSSSQLPLNILMGAVDHASSVVLISSFFGGRCFKEISDRIRQFSIWSPHWIESERGTRKRSVGLFFYYGS